ncbi:unnamed protein product, partial [Urochloa humidicola]
ASLRAVRPPTFPLPTTQRQTTETQARQHESAMAREQEQSPMDAAQRRLLAVSAHLQPPPPAPTAGYGLAANPTAGEYAHAQGYSAVLPEKLQNGKWNVYRSAQSPLRLINRF